MRNIKNIKHIQILKRREVFDKKRSLYYENTAQMSEYDHGKITQEWDTFTIGLGN